MKTIKPPLSFAMTERAYQTTLGDKTYRLGPWPELAGEVRAGSGAAWRPSRHAANQVFDALAAHTSGWPKSHYFNSCLYTSFWIDVVPPRLRRAGCGLVERGTDQTLWPWVTDDPAEQAAADLYDAASAFQSLIPGRFRVIAKRYPNQLFSILRMLSVAEETAELHAVAPALFYLLAVRMDRTRAGEIDRQELLEIIRQPRREILARCCGLRTSNSAVRLIGLLPHQLISSPAFITNLATAADQPVFGHCLAHLTALPEHLAAVLSVPRLWPMITPRLIQEAMERPERFLDQSPAAMLHLAAKWIRKLSPGRPPKFPRFRSAAEIRAFLEPLCPEEASGAKFEIPIYRDDAPLPTPPFKGNADLVSFRTVGDLRQEGKRQRNCCGQSFQVHRAMRKQAWFFSMERPERATILVSRWDGPRSQNRWLIEDIRTYDNGIPLLSTVSHAANILGVPALPVWHPFPQDCWWCDSPFLAVPAGTKDDAAPR